MQGITPACVAAGQRVFFAGFESGHGAEVYISDGTTLGTGRLKEIWPGSSGSTPHLFTPCDQRVFFVADTPSDGRELWVSDGTFAGTNLVLDIWPGTSYGRPEFLVALDGKILFSAFEPTAGRELWVSDGTAAGTQMVIDVDPASQHTFLTNFCACNDRIFFTTTAIFNRGVWVSDGTGVGTIPLGVRGSGLTCSGDRVFFRSLGQPSGSELWVTDGTIPNTKLAMDLAPGAASSNPSDITDVGNGVVFHATVTTFGDIWYSDGTAAGTQHMCTLDPAGNTAPHEFVMCAGHLFFQGYDPAFGREMMWIQTPGASTAALGGASFPDHATLVIENGEVPVIGSTINLVAEGPAASIGVLLGSNPLAPLPAPHIPGLILGGCEYVGLGLGQAVTVGTSVTPNYTWPLVVPNNAALEGLMLHFQMIWVSAGSPTFQLSNALQIAIGTAAPH